MAASILESADNNHNRSIVIRMVFKASIHELHPQHTKYTDNITT